MTLPEPPVNVRLVMVDDTEVPVDTVYVGFQDDTHYWAVVNAPPQGLVKGMNITRLPGKTSVVLHIEDHDQD